MKIHELIEKTGKTENINGMKNVLTIKSYLPFLEKKALAERVIEKSVVEENGCMRINEIDKYLHFTVAVIEAYTNLEFNEDFEVAAQEYDELVQCNKLNAIIGMFETEYKTVLELVGMEADYVMQKTSVEYQFTAFLYGISGMMDGLSDVLVKKIQDFKISDLGVSEEQVLRLNSLLNKFGK